MGPAGPPGPSTGGATYTRWGKSSCPQVKGTVLLYSGFAGGSHYTHQGAGANHLCLPTYPEYSTSLRYAAGIQGHAPAFRAEYKHPNQGRHNDNVPCAVCYVSTRPSVIMIPAKATCPSTWTREYYGYIMTSHHALHHRSTYECMDEDQESLPNSPENSDGALFHHVEASCDPEQLPCPPYDESKELNCVVCTK